MGFGLLALAACAEVAIETSKAPILVTGSSSPIEPQCIKDSEFAIGGVPIGASEQDVIDVLGAPDMRQTGQSLMLDYVDLRLTYPGLDILVFQDRVVDITVKDPRLTTPSGLRLGMTEAELFDVFGAAARPNPRWSTSEKTVYDIYFCNGGELFDLGSSFHIEVGPDGTVNKLRIGSDTP
ncbi:hypothetical protein [Yoonia maricola]|uniref:hypothetical protein n=1 Tax=Yoonia maricola TaxID=420999 RepID=UPI001455A4CB|nr:hypothetical protein [Yoonia maricola]